MPQMPVSAKSFANVKRLSGDALRGGVEMAMRSLLPCACVCFRGTSETAGACRRLQDRDLLANRKKGGASETEAREQLVYSTAALR